jgi:nucleoside diphosphate kinase
MDSREGKGIKSIVLGMITFLIIVGFHKEVLAPFTKNGLPPAKLSKPPIPPSIRPVILPQFLHTWSIAEVIDRFQKDGLEIADIKEITETKQNILLRKVKEGIKFSILSPSVRKEIKGCILVFDVKYDLEKVKKYYLDLNKKGELYSWTFVKDNILLVLDGRVPEEIARKYERSLYELKK